MVIKYTIQSATVNNQPSTIPLVEGEMVYKIIGQLNTAHAGGLFRCYNRVMNPQQILETVLRCPQNTEAVAKDKINHKLYRISTQLLGYVRGTRVEGVWEGAPASPTLFGYTIRWQRRNGSETSNFEDETRILALKNITILSPEQLRQELCNV